MRGRPSAPRGAAPRTALKSKNRGDVLTVGSPSSTSTLLERVFLGSSAAKIVRSSPVPAIVVR